MSRTRPHPRLLLSLLSAVALLCPAGSSPGLPLDPRTVKSGTLANGLVLIVAEQPAAEVVAVEVVVKAGAAEDPQGLAGTAHLLEHVCWVGGGGTDPRARIEDRGGTTGAGTLRDYTRYYATVPADDLPVALQALADMVLRPDFARSVVDRERRIIAEEVAGRRDHPRLWLNDLAFAALFGERHPYGRPIEGTEESLASIQPADLAAFHRAWYVPNNMAIVAAGRARFETVRALVETLFGDLAPQPLPERSRPPVTRPAPPARHVVEVPGSQAHLMAAFVGPAAHERSRVAASDVLAVLLENGCLGRLSGELVEARKLAQSVGVDFLTQRERALFGIWAVCDPDQAERVEQVIADELARIAREGVSPAELAIAKRLAHANWCFANETPGDCAATLAFYEAVDGYRAAIEYPARIAAVGAEDLRQVAAWYAQGAVWVIVTGAPTPATGGKP